MIAGDALNTPFWPDGTGANRALLSGNVHAENLAELAVFVQEKNSYDLDGSGLDSLLQLADTRGKKISSFGGKAGTCSRCQYQSFTQDINSPAIANGCESYSRSCGKYSTGKGPLDTR
jgi:hypothetical protein